MKLLYDSSLPGIGYRNQVISGLMRSAENLLFSLNRIDDIDIILCSSLSFDAWQNCRKYMEHHPTIAQAGFVRHDMRRNQVWQKLSRSIKYIQQYDSINKLLRNAFEINYQPLLKSDLNGIDIYHSPYHRLPRIVTSTKHIKRFLTVHDIIPMLHPEWFGLKKNFSASHFHKEFNLPQALESIDRDTWVTCPSHSTGDDLCHYLKNKIDYDKIVIIPWAASKLFYPCQELQAITLMKQKYCIPEGPYILSLSTLEPRKNIEHVIRCFAQLVEQENLPDLYLVLAGSLGWNYEPIFHELNRFSNIKERIILTGYVADEDIVALYSDALAFVYPSFYEGFGLPPLEAMQCGTPVITSNNSSLPEVVGDAGIMLDSLDRDGLCQSILTIYNDASLREKLSTQSITQAQQFSWSRCAQQTLVAYHKALA